MARQQSCTLGGIPVPGFDTKTLPEKTFKTLHAAVLGPPSQERWAEIPWQADLAEARRKAARENKPLLMWIMDGHPLGCT